MMALFRDRQVAAAQASLLRPLLGPPMTTRLEPQVATGDPATGLQAQVWDPLWLLGRQWQVGEWVGEDNGTPVAITVQAEFEPFIAWHPGPTSAATLPQEWLPLAPGEILGPLVEAEPATASRSELAAAGWALLEALLDQGQTDAAAALRERFPAPAPPAAADDLVSDTWAGSAAVLAGRGIDAAAVAAALTAGTPPWWAAALRGGTARRERADQALAQWLQWFGTEVQPPAGPSSWLPERLEYEFGLATGSTVMRAPAHAGGEVVWADLDLVGSGAPPEAAGPVEPLTAAMVASPLTYPGMPAARFWEFEDAQIDLGAVWADPHELARLLVVEAALVTGGDWVVVPFDVPSGGIVRVGGVSYTDTFGSTWLVEPEEVDPGSWRMFEVTDAASAKHVPGLVVPPPAASALTGPVLEDVGFLRDEGANLVWGLVHLVPGASGRPAVPKSGEVAAPPQATPAAAEPVLGYSLMSGVPATWSPYLPRAAGPDGVALVRGRIPRFDQDCQPLLPPDLGTLLSEHPVLQSTEVPREGVRVRRVPMIARQGDGQWRSWIGRRVAPGRGEAESGLRYDRATTPRPGL